MKKTLIILLFIICPVYLSFSQIRDSITLPEGGKEVSFYATTNIYVTEDQRVSTDHKSFQYFDDISNSIINQFDYSNRPRVLLYADKNTRFEFIEKIKKEIALVEKIFYIMTDSTTDSKRGIPVYLNSLLDYKNSSDILTLDQVKKNEELNGNTYQYFPPPEPLPSVWYHQFEEIIFSGNKVKIDSILKEYKHSTIKLKPQKEIFYKKEKVDSIVLNNLFENSQIVFLIFDYGLSYDDYVFVRNKYNELKQTKKEIAYLIEIPYDLEYQLNSMNIEID